MKNVTKKYVLYENDTQWLFTSVDNYRAYIQNARLISKFNKSEYTKDEVIDTLVSYGSLTKDDIIVRTKENWDVCKHLFTQTCSWDT